MHPALQLHPRLRTPLYRQLVEQLQEQILGGELKPGEQLPSVRELAMQLRINPNTVARSYRELEKDGLLVTHPGKGVFVGRPLVEGSFGELEGLLDRILEIADRRGWSVERVISELRRRAHGRPTATESRRE